MSRRNTKIWPRRGGKEEKKRKNGKCVRERLEEDGAEGWEWVGGVSEEGKEVAGEKKLRMERLGGVSSIRGSACLAHRHRAVGTNCWR